MAPIVNGRMIRNVTGRRSYGKRKRTIGSRKTGHMLVGERRQHILHVIQTDGRALVEL
jgi:hypothetical protein